PAHKEEIQDALKEGVEILCLSTIGMIDENNILINKMDYDEENDILSVSGEKVIIKADSVIFAIGQSIDEGILKDIDGISISAKGVIEIDKNMMTGAKGIFAGGDVVPGKRTVTQAIGHGKKAAKCIDAYLYGREISPNIKPEVANFKKLNTAYFKKNARSEIQKIETLTFTESDISLTERELIAESERCFSCGNCFHCDNCYGFCPDSAIKKSEDGTLTIDYEYCKGCGICASECPCGAIKMTS
ncbi:MAG: FAD-dependent oxidoreductase, partial [Alphaproteobacteria bacterium]|nr:FAD-dependent oxidoreductase [Alphaproteobacteria bacterium]